MLKYDYDIIILGGGAGGLFAASIANGLSAKTCLIEKKKLGGDCTWFGCVPSKALLKSASMANLLRRSYEFGLKMNMAGLDTAGVMSHVRDVIEEVSTHHPAEVFEKRGIKVIFGAPKFIDKNTIEVNGQNLSARRFIICTGSHPLILPIEGLKDIEYLTNENIFSLTKLPESLIVLGGGPIGVELSQALNRLGVKVYLVEMMNRILFREDRETAGILEHKLREEGINMLTGKKAVKFEKKDGKVNAFLEDRTIISASNVLAAVGRAPNVLGLSLDAAGVEYTKSGISTNEYLQTRNKNIFACGDVVGPYMFSHVAAYQAGLCIRNALFRRIAWQKVNYSNIAWATFTEPELAHLGLTEEEAKDKYRDIKIYKTEYSNSDRAVTDLEKNGLVKIITDKKGYIIGAHIAGAQASEIMQGFIIAKALKIPLTKIAPLLYIYPTLSELVKKISAKPLVEKMGNPFIKFLMRVMRGI